MKIQMKEKAMTDKYVSSAKVIDGILILSLPDAVSPVVWQMELGQSKSSALEIRNADNGQFILTLKTPRQDVLDIATYSNRDNAIKALLVTSAALEKGQGQLKANANQNNENGYPVPAISNRANSNGLAIVKKVMIWLASIAGSLILLAIIGMLILAAVRVAGSGEAGTTPTQSSSTSGPVSADEFLENR